MTPQLYQFQGAPLHILNIDGRPAWIAREVGKALGYSHDGTRFILNITSRWGEEFVPDQDFKLLKITEMVTLSDSSDLALESPRGHLVLFESGLHMALLKTRKPLGRALRRWLVSEVLPSITATGGYQPPQASPVAEAPPPRALPPAPSKEAVNASKELRQVAHYMKRNHAPEGEIQGVLRAAAQLLTGDLTSKEEPVPELPHRAGAKKRRGLHEAIQWLKSRYSDGQWRTSGEWAELVKESGLVPPSRQGPRGTTIWIGATLTDHALRSDVVEVRGNHPRSYRFTEMDF